MSIVLSPEKTYSSRAPKNKRTLRTFFLGCDVVFAFFRLYRASVALATFLYTLRIFHTIYTKIYRALSLWLGAFFFAFFPFYLTQTRH